MCAVLLPPGVNPITVKNTKVIIILTFILLMCTFGRAPNNASKWEMGQFGSLKINNNN
jgi:hypothetical protein